MQRCSCRGISTHNDVPLVCDTTQTRATTQATIRVAAPVSSVGFLLSGLLPVDFLPGVSVGLG